LADENIQVSSIHPIGTRTEFFNVVRQRSSVAGRAYNTPTSMTHTPQRVARAIVRCLQRPSAEIWPSRSARFALAVATAFPGVSAWAMRRRHRSRHPEV
jgi:short-subunit dehydrogenase